MIFLFSLFSFLFLSLLFNLSFFLYPSFSLFVPLFRKHNYPKFIMILEMCEFYEIFYGIWMRTDKDQCGEAGNLAYVMFVFLLSSCLDRNL